MEDNWHDARIDPFEPSRVWITTRPSVKVVGPLECFGVKVRKRTPRYIHENPIITAKSVPHYSRVLYSRNYECSFEGVDIPCGGPGTATKTLRMSEGVCSLKRHTCSYLYSTGGVCESRAVGANASLF